MKVRFFLILNIFFSFFTHAQESVSTGELSSYDKLIKQHYSLFSGGTFEVEGQRYSWEFAVDPAFMKVIGHDQEAQNLFQLSSDQLSTAWGFVGGSFALMVSGLIVFNNGNLMYPKNSKEHLETTYVALGLLCGSLVTDIIGVIFAGNSKENLYKAVNTYNKNLLSRP